MANAVLVGTQWGDEGKGKIVDLITERFDVVVRYQGGHNAGHTVVVGETTHILHLIPSGILHPDKCCVIGNGVVVHPDALLQEVDKLGGEAALAGRLFVSDRAHLIMPWHTLADQAEEKRLADARIGTTSRGIGPCYEDKMARRGIRLGDLSQPDLLRRKIEQAVEFKNRILTAVYNEEPLDAHAICDDLLRAAERILPFVTDTAVLLGRFRDEGKKILLEGAQGTLLDVDHGTYPFVTSSSAGAGGAAGGCGMGPGHIDGVIGISKAYTTRVGEGPFPTELHDRVGRQIRERGAEFGATTGRPRRCGWFDAVIGRYSALVNGLTTLVITKMDVLDGQPELKICTGYRHNGRVIETFPASVSVVEEVEPVYEVHPGWESDTSALTGFEQLPAPARSYLARIAELLETDISIISLGPDRKSTILLEESPNLARLLG